MYRVEDINRETILETEDIYEARETARAYSAAHNTQCIIFAGLFAGAEFYKGKEI